jgi:hypothetical protein
MLAFFKKLFGSEPVETPAPYKVETPAPKVEEFPFPSQPAEKATKPKSAKKPTTRKPKAPKA